MSAPDPVMTRIGEGIGLRQRGERAAARQLFARVWNEIGGDQGDPLYRCALAHSMADVQDDVQEELRWDLRALEAAQLVTDERAAGAGMAASADALLPSLYLNLAECCRKLGDTARAAQYLERGRASLAALRRDGYAQMIENGLARVGERLAHPGS